MEEAKKAHAKVLAKGDMAVAGSVLYRVTNAGKKQAEAYGVIKNSIKAVTVKDTVVINGVSCKVTSVAPEAFSLLPKLTKVTLGKYVQTIGKKAFYGDRKLKNIRIKSTGLKKVGKQAFKLIHAKAKIQVPKAKKKAYTRLFKGKGAKKVKMKAK